MTDNEKYMNRCINLAFNGIGNVAPNPMVGCIIVHEKKIIGEGYHQNFGDWHAEVNAIKSVKNKKLLPKSTLYVNLEPCSHHGKTPPCADLIIRNNIPEVIIGSIDPNKKVSGKGIEKLKKAGIKIKTGILENKCINLNKRFYTFHQKNRPYVILKWAQSKDGYIDIERDSDSPNQPTWITNEITRNLVHKWRNEEQAIMIGRKTAELDNPKLTNRSWGINSPIRIVIDNELVLNKSLNIFNNQTPTLIFNKKLSKKNKKLEYIQLQNTYNTISQILDFLYKKNILSIIIEGGEKLLSSFIALNLWDEARIFIGNNYFNKGIMAPKLIIKPSSVYKLIDSELYYFKNNTRI